MTNQQLYTEVNEILVNTDFHIRYQERNKTYQLIHESGTGLEIIFMTFQQNSLGLLFGFLESFESIMDLTGGEINLLKNKEATIKRLQELNELRIEACNDLKEASSIYKKTIGVQGERIRELEKQVLDLMEEKEKQND